MGNEVPMIVSIFLHTIHPIPRAQKGKKVDFTWPKWPVEPTLVKNMRKSNWIISPGKMVKMQEMFEVSPPTQESGQMEYYFTNLDFRLK